MGGVLNIIIGIVFIIGGLTGNLALIGTNSGPALAVLGVVLVIWGVVRMIRSRTRLRSCFRRPLFLISPP